MMLYSCRALTLRCVCHTRWWPQLSSNAVLAGFPVSLCIASIPAQPVHFLVHNSQLTACNNSDRCNASLLTWMTPNSLFICSLYQAFPEVQIDHAGQMKDILTTGLGMFIFGDVKFEPRNVVGVVIGLAGGIFYSYFSYQDSQQRAKDTVSSFLVYS